MIDFRKEQTQAYKNTINYFYTEEEQKKLKIADTNINPRHIQEHRK